MDRTGEQVGSHLIALRAHRRDGWSGLVRAAPLGWPRAVAIRGHRWPERPRCCVLSVALDAP